MDTIRRHQPGSEEGLIGDEVLVTAVVHWVQTIGEVLLGSLAYLIPVLAGPAPRLGRKLERTRASPAPCQPGG